MQQAPDGSDPDSPGSIRIGRLPRSERRATGAFYTPAAVAEHITGQVLGLHDGGLQELRLCDPAVGDGAFLLAAARYLGRRGLDRREVVTRQLWGMDLDPVAVELAGDELARWASLDAAGKRELRSHLRCGDALGDDPATGTFGGVTDREFDVVLGNPPFLGQLRSETVRSRPEAERLRGRFGDVIGPYADTSAVFLLLASQLVRPGGRVAMILPQSVLVARHAARVRRRVMEGMTVEHLWWCPEPVFDAAVRVCAPVLRRRVAGEERTQAPMTRSVGAAFEPASPLQIDREELANAPTWGILAADLLGVPPVGLDGGGTLGGWCEATAGFRDQFYGLAPHVVDDGAGQQDDERFPRLVTCGLIDPGVSHWGRRPARFAGRPWGQPRVDMDALESSDPTLHRWVTARLRPKIVVATQTRVVEAAVDVHGLWVPSTPTIAVAPRSPEHLWAAAAVLMSPAISAWALGRCAGAALGADHLKLSARDILAIPLPRDEEALVAAGALMAERAETDPATVRSGLLEAGRLTCAAYGVGEEVWSWWAGRLPSCEDRRGVDGTT